MEEEIRNKKLEADILCKQTLKSVMMTQFMAMFHISCILMLYRHVCILYFATL